MIYGIWKFVHSLFQKVLYNYFYLFSDDNSEDNKKDVVKSAEDVIDMDQGTPEEGKKKRRKKKKKKQFGQDSEA